MLSSSSSRAPLTGLWRAPGLALLLTLGMLITACAEDSCPEVRVCDVSQRTCQQSIMKAMSCLRGGNAKLPPVHVLDQAALQERLAQGDDSSEADRLAYQRWARGLAMFGLAPTDYGMDSARSDTTDEIAAVYFSDTKEIVVVDRGQSLESESAVSTFAHEVVHALQDADYDLIAFQKRWVRDYDSQLAVTAIIEGEAVLYQSLVTLQLEGLSVKEVAWEEWFGGWRSATLEDAEHDAAPVALGRIRFPYAFGGGFVVQHWLANGRAGVDALIDAPPLTTREIMFGAPSGGSLDEERSSVRERGLPVLGDSFVRVSNSALGAWITRIFAAKMGVPVSQRLSASSRYLADSFSVQADETTGDVVAAWRTRFEEAPGSSSWPGFGWPQFTSWTDSEHSEVCLLASAEPLSGAAALAWQSADVEPEEAAASASVAPPWLRQLPAHAITCPVQRRALRSPPHAAKK